MNNKFLDAMQFRHATKKFDPSKIISDEKIADILEMGRLSPSSFGFEPQKFVIVQNHDVREQIKQFTWGAQGQLPTASHFIIILARKKKAMHHSSDYIQHMMRDVRKMPDEIAQIYNNYYEKFQEQDFNLAESDRAMFDWASKQSYIALANMMTGAAYIGIDSCAIEGFDYKSAKNFLENALGIDTEEFGPAVMLALGYGKTEPKAKTRQNIEDITFWFK